MTKTIKILIGALALSVLAGCASVPLASPELDAQAKSFAAPAAGKANIYVYRHESFGAAIRIPVSLDGRKVASTAAKTYMLLSVAPGPHQVLSDAEVEDKLEVNAEAGKTYYIWQEIKMGAFMARTKLQMVDEAKARKHLARCKRVLQSD